MECTVLLSVLGVLCVLLYRWSTRSTLPGPFCLPVVGYLPFMTKKPYVKLTELAKTYGPIYKLRLGSVDVVVITDSELIREALSKDAFFGRPPDTMGIPQGTKVSDAFLDLPWREQRRFALHQLRDLGLGKSKLEHLIQQEIEELLSLLSSSDGKPLHPGTLLTPSMSNNVASLIFGSRMRYSDPRRRRLDQLISQNGRLSAAVSWLQFFPWMKIWMKWMNCGSGRKLEESLEAMRCFCREEISQHEDTLDPSHTRDFIDGYLLEIEKRKDSQSFFRKDVLTDLSRMFFGAGTHTARIVVEWVLLVCAAHPHLQTTLQMQIDRVLPSADDFPAWTDRARLPLVEAVILEAMRWRTVLPLNIMRRTLEKTELGGHTIPKDTRVLTVLWSVDHDPSVWGSDAHLFRPSRFLTPDGKRVERGQHCLSFSTGKRSCPGKPMAEIEVFLYVVSILHRFRISLPDGREPDFDNTFLGIGLEPRPQELCFRPRWK